METRSGFTILELIIVILVGAILTTIAVRGLGSVQSRASVRQARNVYASMHARARAQAVELGERVELRIDPVGDSIWLSRDGAVLHVVRFRSEMGVDIRAGSNTHTVCMDPRGFADASCNSFESSPLTLTFAQGADTASLQVLPLGQVLY